MPERPVCFSRINEFRLAQPKDFFNFFDKENIENIALNNGLEVLGQGNFSVVFAAGKDKAFALDKQGGFARNVYVAQLEYYYQQVLTTIYPEHFPRFYGAFSFLEDKKGNISRGGTLRERIYFDPDKQKKSEDDGYYPATKGQEADSRGNLSIKGWAISKFVPKVIVNKMLEWRANGIPLAIDFGKPEHFREDKQGRVMYLDTPHVFKGEELHWNPIQVRKFMKRKGFRAATINSVERIVERVIHLEERAKLIGWLGKKLMYEDERTVEAILQGNFNQWLKQFCSQYNLEYRPMDKGDLKYIKLQIGINRFVFQNAINSGADHNLAV